MYLLDKRKVLISVLIFILFFVNYYLPVYIDNLIIENELYNAATINIINFAISLPFIILLLYVFNTLKKEPFFKLYFYVFIATVFMQFYQMFFTSITIDNIGSPIYFFNFVYLFISLSVFIYSLIVSKDILVKVYASIGLISNLIHSIMMVLIKYSDFEMQGFWDNYSTYINLLRIIQFIAMVVLIVIFNKDGMQFNKNKKIEEEINLI